MDGQTRQWWTFLRAASLLNIALWTLTVVSVPWDGPQRVQQATCAAIYVAVCAFRSFWPRVDLERTVLREGPLSSIALGRSAATLAELAFTVQCALWVHGLAGRLGLGWGQVLAWSFVPVIALAQACCWRAVLTLDHRWHAAEEVLWGLFMGLLAAVFVAAWPHCVGLDAWVIGVGLLGTACGAYVMLILDVPMYFARFGAERARGAPLLGLCEGWSDAVRRRHASGAWEVWREEVAWMTPYFSVGVWLSIALVWLTPGS